MTKATAKKVLKNPYDYGIRKQVEAFKLLEDQWDLQDNLALVQLMIERQDPNDEKYSWHMLQWSKELRGVLSIIEDKGKADSVVVHNHIHKPK